MLLKINLHPDISHYEEQLSQTGCGLGMSANSNALNQLKLGSLETKRLRKTTTKKWSVKFIGGNVIEENLRKGFDDIAVLIKLC